MSKMRISFDWDGCLESSEKLRKFFQLIHYSGVLRACVITSRDKNDPRNNDLRQFLGEYIYHNHAGEFRDLVYFTENKLKTIQDLNIAFHFDDDQLSVALINEWREGTAFLVHFSMQDFFFESDPFIEVNEMGCRGLINNPNYRKENE